MKNWFDGGWERRYDRDSLVYYGPQEYKVGQVENPKIEIEIPRLAYEQLKEWMVRHDPDGVIRTDRKEDLKIIHRLLDVLNKEIKP